MSTADAVDRETAWLQTSGDGLPALLATAGGPFEVVQAYRARTPAMRAKGQLYVLRKVLREKRFANQRRMAKYEMRLKLVWPLSSGTGNAEDEQRAFDAAADLVLVRVGGFVGDKSHGGRFRSAAEDPDEVTIDFADPEITMPTSNDFRAEITYWIDDAEITG